MKATAMLFVLNLLVLAIVIGLYLVFRALAGWTPAFGLGFTAGLVFALLVMRMELGRWP